MGDPIHTNIKKLAEKVESHGTIYHVYNLFMYVICNPGLSSEPVLGRSNWIPNKFSALHFQEQCFGRRLPKRGWFSMVQPFFLCGIVEFVEENYVRCTVCTVSSYGPLSANEVHAHTEYTGVKYRDSMETSDELQHLKW